MLNFISVQTGNFWPVFQTVSMHVYGVHVLTVKDMTAGHSQTHLKELAQSNQFQIPRDYQLCQKLLTTSMIPISRVVIDNLHLYHADHRQLINLLTSDIRQLDGIEKSTNVCLAETNNLKKYESFLAGTSGSLKWRDLTGPEKYSLFKQIDTVTLFPNLPNVVILQKLWMEFIALNDMIRSESMPTFEIRRFEEKAKLWL